MWYWLLWVAASTRPHAASRLTSTNTCPSRGPLCSLCSFCTMCSSMRSNHQQVTGPQPQGLVDMWSGPWFYKGLRRQSLLPPQLGNSEYLVMHRECLFCGVLTQGLAEGWGTCSPCD